jgi:predicted dehydrogenase
MEATRTLGNTPPPCSFWRMESASSAPVPPLRWGILATGRIAGVFAAGLKSARAGRLVAAGSRTAEAARRFATEHGIATANTHGSYEALLADPEVEAVYISTPHPQHAEWVVKAAAAGKHILCEKPLGLNHAEAVVMIAAARRAGVVLMEAFMYRCHPQTAKIVSLIREGALGTVGLVQATFSFRTDYHPESRLWANAAGGGGILDVGCYAVSMSRLVAGAAAGRAFLDPVEVSGAGVLHPETGVDVYAAGTLKFPNGVIAQVAAGVGLNQENVVRIYGSAGWLLVPSPWVVNRDGGVSKLLLHRAGAAAPEEFVIEAGPLYGLEADAFARAVRAGTGDVPAMSADDTLGNLATLDRWRRAIGLAYAAEQPGGSAPQSGFVS